MLLVKRCQSFFKRKIHKSWKDEAIILGRFEILVDGLFTRYALVDNGMNFRTFRMGGYDKAEKPRAEKIMISRRGRAL